MMIKQKRDDVKNRIAEIACEVWLEYAHLLARELYKAFLHEYAGQRVPKRTAAKRAIRNQHIREQAAAGRDVGLLAMAFKLSKSQIRRILNDHGKSESD